MSFLVQAKPLILGYHSETVFLLINNSKDYKTSLPSIRLDSDHDLSLSFKKNLISQIGYEGITLSKMSFYEKSPFYEGGLPSSLYLGFCGAMPVNSRNEKRLSEGLIWKEWEQLGPLIGTGLRGNQFWIDFIHLFRTTPFVFELLPTKFSIGEFRHVIEVVLRQKLDARNFRKKWINSGLIVPLEETRRKPKHRAAHLYRFDKVGFRKKMLIQKGINLF